MTGKKVVRNPLFSASFRSVTYEATPDSCIAGVTMLADSQNVVLPDAHDKAIKRVFNYPKQT